MPFPSGLEDGLSFLPKFKNKNLLLIAAIFLLFQIQKKAFRTVFLN